MSNASELHSFWSLPDNSRLTSKQFSFRLPVHVAAKIAALCDMYPQKNRTEIVGDLLSTAIEDLLSGLPYVDGKPIGVDPDTGEEYCEDVGPRPRFWALADKHYKALEREMGNKNPPSLQEAMRKPKTEAEG
ncbi:MAG: hypothetical protein WA435_03495 [Gallionellaceae bacterium]